MSASTPSTLLSAVVTTGAGDAVRVASPGCQVHVYSAAGSSCTVLIQGSQDNLVWHTLKSLTDPGAAPDGAVYIGTAMQYMRANVSARVSGTITAKLLTLDVDPGPWASIDSPVNSAGALSVTSLTNSGLTATRIPFTGTAGLQEDEAAFTYDKGGNLLTVGAIATASVTDSGLTATRVVIAGAAGILEDDGGMTYVKGTDTLSVVNIVSTLLKGGMQLTPNAYAVDGAISVAPQLAMLTRDAVGAYTLAAPTVTTHDGYEMEIVATKARAHVVTFAAGTINGGANVTATFGGAIGDSIRLRAYQGVWYTVGEPRNVTIAP